MLIASFAAYSAALLGCFIAVPQIVRLVRTHEVVGISSRSWEVGTLSSAAWLAYGLRIGDGAQVLANVCAVTGGLLVLWLVLAAGAERRRRLASFAGVASILALAVATAPLPWLTVPLAATGMASRIPQLRSTGLTWWHRRESGVSAATWVVTVVVASLWLFYGLSVGDPAIAWAAGLSATTAVAILVAETCRRPQLTRVRCSGWLGTPAAAVRGSADVDPAQTAPGHALAA